jgi:hypothetical protein
MHVQSKYDRSRWLPDVVDRVAAGRPERCGLTLKLLPWRRCGGGDTREAALRPAEHDDAVEAAIAVAE